MSASLFLGCLWVLAATITAFLPMRRQYAPGVSLLIAAPVLLAFTGYQHGLVFAALGLVAFVSMFRNPLRFLWRKYVKREAVELPK